MAIIQTVPNQKIIYIPYKNINNFETDLQNASIQLSGKSSFKIWVYFYIVLQENTIYPLSSIEMQRWCNCSPNTYYRGIQQLIEQTFLITTSRSNYYIFNANPNGKINIQQQEIYINKLIDNFSINKISKGEEIIQNLLNQHDIPFIREFTSPYCLFPDTKYPARFDFFVNNQYFIEFDGIQHFKASNNFWNTTEQLQKTQLHDDIKNQWCFDNNIPLIRIPYSRLNTLCLNDLLLETSQYIV